MVKRGEIWLVNLDPVEGHEICKTRPCVIVSPDELHYLRTVLIAPMTTGNKPTPFRQVITFQGKSGLILSEQIRSIDQSRLVQKLGECPAEVLSALLDTLQELFAP